MNRFILWTAILLVILVNVATSEAKRNRSRPAGKTRNGGKNSTSAHNVPHNKKTSQIVQTNTPLTAVVRLQCRNGKCKNSTRVNGVRKSKQLNFHDDDDDLSFYEDPYETELDTEYGEDGEEDGERSQIPIQITNNKKQENKERRQKRSVLGELLGYPPSGHYRRHWWPAGGRGGGGHYRHGWGDRHRYHHRHHSWI